MNQFENEVRVAIYRLFIENGRAPVVADVAEAIEAPPIDVENAFKQLHDEHVLVLAPGTPYIWMANPLSALPTPYEVSVGEKTLWANCIWDACGILAMLHTDGDITGRCPDCGTRLRLEVRDETIAPLNHTVHYAVPAAHWWDDIGFN